MLRKVWLMIQAIFIGLMTLGIIFIIPFLISFGLWILVIALIYQGLLDKKS